jgi:hypothetical protein
MRVGGEGTGNREVHSLERMEVAGEPGFTGEREAKARRVGHPKTWKSASVMSAPMRPPLVTSNAE